MTKGKTTRPAKQTKARHDRGRIEGLRESPQLSRPALAELSTCTLGRLRTTSAARGSASARGSGFRSSSASPSRRSMPGSQTTMGSAPARRGGEGMTYPIPDFHPKPRSPGA